MIRPETKIMCHLLVRILGSASNASLDIVWHQSGHSCESRNPEGLKDWIPGQARNDNQSKEIYDAPH